MNGINISRETFEEFKDNPAKQNLILFDLIRGTYDCSHRLSQKIDEKNKEQDDEIRGHDDKIEDIKIKMASRQKREMGVASMFGLVGGFLAHFAEWAIKGKVN